ncbi:MAG: DUF362 domain-containing protein [Candidatus Thorarchaeota archaeon]|nr:DUF362 domain-containing protein [Candidatus Thorarchaeota archaeon]
MSQQHAYDVAEVQATQDLRHSIERAVGLLGGLKRFVNEDEVVTLKPNLNTADPFPASSDPQFIKALGEALLNAGTGELRIVESSMFSLSTRAVAEKNGLATVASELGAELVYLDEHDWKRVRIPKGKYLKTVSVGASVTDVGTLVLAPCLKTHRFARFTMSMKMFVGWVKPSDRLKMHARHLEEKCVELASYFRPTLIVMDGRRAFVTGGPARGEVVSPNLVLASNNMLAIDAHAVDILRAYHAENRIKEDTWSLPQIRHAATLGIGPLNEREIRVLRE